MKKKLLLTTLLTLAIGVMLATKVQAGYQSIPTGTAIWAPATTWMPGIRRIESASGGMGLSESINTSSLLATTEANNVDVHLQKNTEYGAAVILSASNYGKQGNGTKGSNYVNSSSFGLATSTGNKYGICELGKGSEWAAGGGSSFVSSSIDKRYIDIYTTSNTSYKKGDATYETNGWHGSSSSWLYSNKSGFYRGMNSATFNYRGADGGPGSSSGNWCDNPAWYNGLGRACVVSGAGF